MAIGKKVLGKGLSALIPENLEKEELNKIQEIDIDMIRPNPNQPRKSFVEDKLEELAESIKQHGVIQPIIVKKEDNVFMIIAGERRWRASRMASLTSIPCIVRDIENRNVSEIALIENIQREDLNPVDEANAYSFIMNRYAMTQEELANVVGKSRVYVTNTLRLLNLSDYVKSKILSEEISQGHARAMISLENVMQIELTDKIIAQGLSVRDVENIVKNSKKEKKSTIAQKDKYVIDLEEKLTDKFSAKVNIINKRNKGKIEIEFKNNQELDRILSLFEI